MAFNLINFKKGTLSALNTLITNNGIEEGTFYLTVDDNINTSRLFIGTGAGSALPVNHSIITVADTTALNNTSGYQDGDFAYVTAGNILAVRKGNAWVQINAPEGKEIDSFTPSISTSAGVATITWTMHRHDNVDIKESDGTTMPSITMTGSNGVSVSSSGKAITISGDPATLASSAVLSNSTNLTLSSTGNTASGTVAISGGSNVTLSGDANAITIAAKDTTNASLTITEQSNGFEVKVTDSANAHVEDTVDPIITVLTNETGTTTESAHFVNGTAALNVYSKDEINRRLKAIDAMTYRGTVGVNGTYSDVSNITNPAVGDTFKVISSLSNITTSDGTGSAKNGDLLIANGTETDGTITAASLYYDIIPAGDDTNQTYSVTSDTNGIKIHDNVANSDIGGIKLVQGNDITLTESGTTSKSITVAHETMSSAIDGNPTTATGVTQSNLTNLTINAITGLVTDNGHVTGVTVTPYTVKDTNASLTSVVDTVAQATASRSASVTTAATLTDSGNTAVTRSDAFTLSSDNLVVTADGTNKDIKMNLVWGTF